MKTVKVYSPKDTDGIRALRKAMDASVVLTVLESTLPVETQMVLEAVVEELRWMTESRARWKTVCELRQLTIHEDEVPS